MVLGTGGIGHDLFAVMRAFVLSARLDAESADIVGPADALRMASRDGARALRLLGSVGSIEIGKKADLICVALDPARVPLRETGNVEEVVAEACGPGDVTAFSALLRTSWEDGASGPAWERSSDSSPACIGPRNPRPPPSIAVR